MEFARDRVAEFLDVLERMAAGDTRLRLTISAGHDELDAIAHGVNVLVGELGWATARTVEAHEERAVAAERANMSKNVFLRNMSHEIRTPIAAMLGFAGLLASDDLAPEKRSELVRRLQANALAVLSLLDDLLDLAKLDAHKIVLNPEPVSVIELVQEVFASLEIDSRAKGLEMRVEATRRGARHRFGPTAIDFARFWSTSSANAVKFTDAGGIVIALSATRDAEGERWTIDVTDTGIGIAADRHPHLFEPFEQVDASIARVYGGTGLGLALSRRLAEQLGGSLALLHSAPGAGNSLSPDREASSGGAESRICAGGRGVARRRGAYSRACTCCSRRITATCTVALRTLLERIGRHRGIGIRRPRSRGQGGLGHVRCGPDGPAHAARGRPSGHARAAQPGLCRPDRRADRGPRDPAARRSARRGL